MLNRNNLKLVVISTMLSALLPVAAQNASNPVNQQTSTGTANKTEKNFPKTATAFVVGSIVGTPISAVRYSAYEVKHAAKGMVDGMHNHLVAPVFMIIGPTAILLGGVGGAVIEGPCEAVKNSWVHSQDKPFSKEAFSLGPMESSSD